MEKSKLKGSILKEFENLISRSCENSSSLKSYEPLHIALLKKYYNAAVVTIDYHRHRVQMEVVVDDTLYNPKTINTYIPLIHTNLIFKSLRGFLSNCIETDNKSIGFYAQLLKSYTKKSDVYSFV